MKPDEVALFNLLRDERPQPTRAAPTIDPLADRLGIPRKRAWRLLEKWSDKGWWDCGVSDRTGWFTDKAPEELP